jgi:MFS family permease
MADQSAQMALVGNSGEMAKITPSYRRLVIASALGTTIEWYDFWCYAIIGPLVFDHMFFPKSDPLVGTILVYATFAVGFLTRPIGGLFFGHFSDRIGRKSILMITLFMMGIASTAIGLLPGYASIGVAAPLLLVSLRFLQGFALGGESIGALALILENAPQKDRGFYASWCNAAGPIGIILSSGLASLFTAVWGKAAFQGWGWRIPFLLSVILLAVGAYMRAHVDESFMFTAAKNSQKISRVPIAEVFRNWKKSLTMAFFVNIGHSTYAYLSTVFIIAYAAKKLGMPMAALTSAFLIANVFKLCTVPYIGHLSDRKNRRPFILGGFILGCCYLPVLFYMVSLKSVFFFILGITISEAVVHAIMWSPEAAFTAELFATEVRVSGASFGKQLGVVFGGGCAPLIATSLMGRSSSFMSVNYYCWAVFVVSFIVLLFAPETRKRAL